MRYCTVMGVGADDPRHFKRCHAVRLIRRQIAALVNILVYLVQPLGVILLAGLHVRAERSGVEEPFGRAQGRLCGGF